MSSSGRYWTRFSRSKKFDVSNLTEGQATKVGQLAGANKVIFASVAKFSDKYLILAKGIDVSTGIVEISDQVLSTSVDGFIDVFPVLADRLVRKARGETVADFAIPENQAQPSASASPPTASPSPPSASSTAGTPNTSVNPAGIGGSYQVVGKNADGSSYWGTCVVAIKPDGDYSFAWNIGDSAFVGTGKLEGDVMTVDWGDSSPVIYQVQQDGKVLTGTWADGKATENLTIGAATENLTTGAASSQGFDFAGGMGYVHTMGGVAGLWTDGAEGEFSIAYRTSSNLGFEAGGLIGLTGITNALESNTVALEESNEFDSTASGSVAAYFAFFLGPRFSIPLGSSASRCVLSISAGGLYQGQVGTVTSDDSIMTSGFGGYASLSARFFPGPGSFFWGVRLRYFYSYSNETDFWEFENSYIDDQRLIASVEIGIQ